MRPLCVKPNEMPGNTPLCSADRSADKWLKLKPDYFDGMGEDLDVLIVGWYWGRSKQNYIKQRQSV